jgi:hypothetical protein
MFCADLLSKKSACRPQPFHSGLRAKISTFHLSRRYADTAGGQAFLSFIREKTGCDAMETALPRGKDVPLEILY